MLAKVAIFGAGGIGTMLAHGLARADIPATLIARGAKRDALCRDGITMVEKGTEDHQTIPVADITETKTLGPQDAVLISLKQQQIEVALPEILPLIGPDTLIVPAINGIPWWYFEGEGGPHASRRIDSVDPQGALSKALPAKQILGCVVYIGAEMVSPSRVDSLGYRKLILGSPFKGSAGPKAEALVSALEAAQYSTTLTETIRDDIWMKLWGNIWANPLSVVCNASMGEMHDDALMRELAMKMMRETGMVAASLGIEIPISPEQRIADAAGFGSFKTSMLQDFERGSGIELDGILGAVLEIGRLTGIETPTLETVHTLTRFIALQAGAYDVRA